MSETQFAMVSEWMPNGNIKQYVKAHPDENRFELVSLMSWSLPSSLTIGWFRSWEMLRGVWFTCTSRGWSMGISKGYALEIQGHFQSLMDFVCLGQCTRRPNGPRLPGRLRFAYDHIRSHEPHDVHTGRHDPMDEPGKIRSQKNPPDEALGLLRPWDGDIRGAEWSGSIFPLWGRWSCCEGPPG